MGKTKVLHVSYGGLGKGGVSTVIFSICENLTERFDFGCVVFAEKGVSEERFKKIGKLHRVNCYIKGSFFEKLARPIRMYSAIKRICKNEHYDVIHCHNGPEEAFALLAAKHAGVKVRIAHSHNTTSPQKSSLIKKKYCKLLMPIVCKNATKKVACSKQAAIDFFGSEGVTVIPNSIQIDRFFCDREGENSLLRFVHVGRYDYSKNQEFVLDVFNIIHQKNVESSLKLVGFGMDKEKLKKKTQELHLEDSVFFVPGDVYDIPSEYKSADFMIFPSRNEGFGIVLIEAQAAGVYCFVSEAVQPEADAGSLEFLSLRDSAEIWAEAILNHYAKHPKKSKNKKERYDKYRAEIVSDRYGELYESENE